MNIKLISVGKLKEKYLLDAVSEYTKRISKFAKIEIIEVKDEHAPDNVSDKEIEQIKSKEGQRILEKISKDEYVFLLELRGKHLTSEEFASKLEELPTYGNPKITFVIGGSFGNAKEVLERSNFDIAFSKMTFPHQLMKVFLLEQIYRGCMINNNNPYHK